MKGDDRTEGGLRSARRGEGVIGIDGRGVTAGRLSGVLQRPVSNDDKSKQC